MKKLRLTLAIIAINLLTLYATPANAEFIIKYGMVVSNQPDSNNLTFAGLWAETDNCDYCIALFAVETCGESKDQPRDRLVGVDYVIKMFQSEPGAIRVNLGFAVADNGGLQGGEVFNFHFGSSMELKVAKQWSLIFSYDHFSNGKTLFDRDDVLINEPLDLMSIGILF